MIVEMIEHGEHKMINIQDLGSERKNSHLFHQMLNNFDPFIHERPLWTSAGRMMIESKITAEAMLSVSNVAYSASLLTGIDAL